MPKVSTEQRIWRTIGDILSRQSEMMLDSNYLYSGMCDAIIQESHKVYRKHSPLRDKLYIFFLTWKPRGKAHYNLWWPATSKGDTSRAIFAYLMAEMTDEEREQLGTALPPPRI